MKNGKRGFTRAESLVVILIIAFLFSVSAALMPSKDRAEESAKRALCADRLRQVGAAMIMYASSYDNALPSSKHPVTGYNEGHPYVAYRDDWRSSDTSVDPRGKLIPIRLAYLYETGFITDPNLFYCPSNESYTYRYESYIDPSPWGTLPQNYNSRTSGNQWVRIGYTYYPTDPNTVLINDRVSGEWAPREETTRFDLLDSNMPYLTDTIHRRVSLSHKSGIRTTIKGGIVRVTVIDGGVNALFKDGHVVYADDPALFTLGVWDPWENEKMGTNYPPFYYTIFKHIQP